MLIGSELREEVLSLTERYVLQLFGVVPVGEHSKQLRHEYGDTDRLPIRGERQVRDDILQQEVDELDTAVAVELIGLDEHQHELSAVQSLFGFQQQPRENAGLTSTESVPG